MASWYPLIKHLHMTLVAISIIGFVARFYGVQCSHAWVAWRATRVLPHVIDTFLLLGGVSLALILSLNPVLVPWLGVKLLLLIAYVVLGTYALKRAKTRAGQVAFFVAAVGVFAQMVGVALRHNPWGWLA